jgi:glycosyltransferase involved in cell wall biosynthesis
MVTTIIPVYNRAGLVGASVQSVLDQTNRPIENILVDDGSTDNTLAELNRLEGKHPDIVRVTHRENGGPGLARESGRLLARGEFIQYLDSDDLLLPRKFEVQVAALRTHPECGIAYGRTRLIDEHGVTLREPSKWTGKKFEQLFPALLVDRWWHTHTPLYRRSLCDQIGPWPELQPEDWDYDARAGATGTRLAFCDEVVSSHRQHTGHRVTTRPYESYLPQEVWFLPRLYDCAVRAGVPQESPEMLHFTRWAFSLARRVGALGWNEAANTLMALAVQAGGKTSAEMRVVRFCANRIGWRMTGRLCQFANRFRNEGHGGDTLAMSWEKKEDFPTKAPRNNS